MDCLKSEFIDVQMLDIETTVSLMFGRELRYTGLFTMLNHGLFEV